MFKLDPSLAADTFEVCEHLDCKILVVNNSIVSWFIVCAFYR